MNFSSVACSCCLPVASLICIVCPSAVSASQEESSHEQLTAELNRHCGSMPQWPTILNFLSNIKTAGNIDWQDRQGMTLLEYCMLECRERRADVVQILLLAGASPDVAGVNGMTPLHRAAYFNDYRSALRLLAHGARVGVKDAQGRVPLQLAQQPQLRKLLRTGRPVECKSPFSLDVWRAACVGDAEACYSMSTLYDDGIGEQVGSISDWAADASTPNPDAAERRAWLEQAAKGGDARALYELGIRLLWGRDGVQDEARARQYLQRAAAAGHAEASELLQD